MNKYIRKGFCLVLAIALIASTFAGCKKINYVTNGAIGAIHEIKDGSWLNQGEEDVTASGDVAVIDALTPGTYGGVEFNTLEDVANYYKEAYDYTKSLTATYSEKGEDRTYYKLLGEESLSVGQVMIDGSANAVINKLVPGIVDGLFSANTYGLVPCCNRNPDLDNNQENVDNGEIATFYDFRTSHIEPDYLLEANVVDNGDGTITLTMQPKLQEMAMRGEGPQGTFFEVLGDIGSTVASISVISFAQGTPEENIKVTYAGGKAVVKIDTATKEIVEADYDMIAKVAVNHATVTVIKDKSASLDITYKNHYPASDEYLMKSREITRK